MEVSIIANTAVLVLAFVAAAQEPTYSVQGSVAVEEGVLYQPVIVNLEAPASRPVDEAYADLSGSFAFRNVPAGTYYLHVKENGFEEFVQRIEVPEQIRDVAICLHRRLNRPPPQDDEVLGDKYQVDVRQLSIDRKAVQAYRRALVDIAHGDRLRAMRRLKKSLRIAPNFAEAAISLGSLLYKAGRLEEAETVLVRALAFVPQGTHLRLMLAVVLARERKYGPALIEIDAYLKEGSAGPEHEFANKARSRWSRVIEKESR